MQVGRDRTQVGQAEKRFTTAVTGDDDNASDKLNAVGQPEIKLHFLALTLAFLFHSVGPLRVADLPVPVSSDGLLWRRGAPSGFVEHAIPDVGTGGPHVLVHPAKAVTFRERFKATPLRAAVRMLRRSPLLIEPRDNLLRPLRAVLAQAGAAEMDALSVAFAKRPLECVGVRSLVCDAVLP